MLPLEKPAGLWLGFIECYGLMDILHLCLNKRKTAIRYFHRLQGYYRTKYSTDPCDVTNSGITDLNTYSICLQLAKITFAQDGTGSFFFKDGV